MASKKYHHFRLSFAEAGKVFVEGFLLSTEKKVLFIIWKSISVTSVREKCATIFTDQIFRSEITPLHEVKLPQHVT